METLYNLDTDFSESDFSRLYVDIKRSLNQRSLLLLYTNFESTYAMERVLPILRRINTIHLLVVVFFDNTDIRDFAQQEVETTEDIYLQTIAQKYLSE